MCTNSGEYARDKIRCDKILIGFQPLITGSHKRPRRGDNAGKNFMEQKWKGKQTIWEIMCMISGEYAHEKIICDKISIGYAPTTYNNDGQPTKRNKQITREWAMTCFSYTYIFRHLRKVSYGEERTRGCNLRKWNSRRTPSINKKKNPYK